MFFTLTPLLYTLSLISFHHVLSQGTNQPLSNPQAAFLTNPPHRSLASSSSSSSGGWKNLDNSDISTWLRYTEPPGMAMSDVVDKITDNTAPSGDNTVFHMGITSSDTYTNVYRYQVKEFSNAVNWKYSMKYKFRGTANAPQALEFPFSIYTGEQRLEMAMQWVSPIESGNPRWRVWGGMEGYWNDNRPNGEAYDFKQDLAADVWHSFVMTGKIKDNKIYYEKIVSDDVTFKIGETYPGVADETETMTVIAFQIDNNYAGTENDVYIDEFSLTWDETSSESFARRKEVSIITGLIYLVFVVFL